MTFFALSFLRDRNLKFIIPVLRILQLRYTLSSFTLSSFHLITRHANLSYFLDGLNCGSSVRKPKNNGLLRKKNIKGLILKQKGTRMAEDGED